jgi:asparagine synthase (glutamine-hydrolysing)
MCGILGIASRSSIVGRDWFTAGRDAMGHRGPDDAGEWWSADGRVGLAHRRLSIIDLSTAGHQPMADAWGAILIVLNGEIYNFRELRAELASKGAIFYSHSDTEVILAAYREWSTDCVSRLNGMFAFALYDTQQRTLFLARDRAGEKPLFYALSDGTLRFASELKALMADPALPRRIDAEALDCYLAMGFVPGERCILQGVNKLPPAHALVFDLATGQSRRWRYWQLPEPNASAAGCQGDETELLNELETLLEDAVRRQLVADVPVGVLLSGGVDSSLVTAMAVRATPKVKTFTIRFPGYGQYDETEHARLIARHFGTEHVELEASESTVDLLPLLARQFDEPIIDSSMIPTSLVCGLVRRHCTVALGGDGGDELFGGYSHYNRLLKVARLADWIPHAIRRATSGVVVHVLPLGFPGRNWAEAFGSDFEHEVPLVASYFDRRSRRRLMGGDAAGVADDLWRGYMPSSGNLLDRATRIDFETYLGEDILVKVDRASMMHSLEVRAPMLDYRIIEFAFGKIPARLKVTPQARKILLKKLAARMLPPGFDMQRKQGFTIPLDTWLQDSPWRSFFEEVLLSSAQDGVFNREFVGKLLRNQRRGSSNSERLFALVMFELWCREYNVTLG